MARNRVKGTTIMNMEMAEIAPVEKQNVGATGGRFREVEFRSMSEKIANDRLYYKNYYYPGGKESFPSNPKLHTVDKFFPYAEGGPLFVDEVSRTDDRNLFVEKTEAMKKLGHRYVAILPGMTELDIRERVA